jgi:hypothetical protein
MPVVLGAVGDPVAEGLTLSLARPQASSIQQQSASLPVGALLGTHAGIHDHRL